MITYFPTNKPTKTQNNILIAIYSKGINKNLKSQ